MTRKRFIKLLMGHGVSRNEAQAIARNAGLAKRGGYSKRYTAWKKLNDLSSPFGMISNEVTSMVDSFATLCSALGAAVSAFSSVLTVAMQEPSPFGDTCLRCGGTGTVSQMQSMAQFNGPSIRGPDKLIICPRCLGTGRNLYKEENQ